MNSDGSVNFAQSSATPPLDVLKIMILQRRDSVLEAIESYYKMRDAGSSPPTFYVTSRVRSLFFDIEPVLRRYFSENEEKKKEFAEIEAVCLGRDVMKHINTFRRICSILDEKNLTKWDNMKKINSARVEEENEEKGL